MMMGEMLDWKSIGSILATFMFLRTALRDFLPPEVKHFLTLLFSRLASAMKPRVSIIIDEYESSSYSNELFDAAHSYIGDKCRQAYSSSSSAAAHVLRITKNKNSRGLTFSMDSSQQLHDHFPAEGTPGAVLLRWSFHSVQRKSGGGFGRGHDEHRFYQLSFHRRHQARVQSDYLPYVLEEAARIRFLNRERRLFTNRSAVDDGGCSRQWSAVPFSHPSTFDTVAIDPALKEEIKSDLLKFVNRRDYYSRVGRAWKRGYLLYGPPGTGKTSLIAAIANFLEFDIYDLELTAVTSNSQLRKLLVSTSSKSIVVVEDVDCSLDLSDRNKDKKFGSSSPSGELAVPAGGDEEENRREKKKVSYISTVSLSGVLNFVDGLWSSCVGERLIIFTTNHVEKLDPALLRPGRMDKHVHLSYCGFPAFKTLAKNYLGVGGGGTEEEDGRRYGELMREADELLPEVKMTPADIAEVFMGVDDDADAGMNKVVEEMRRRRAAMLQQSEVAASTGDGGGKGEEEIHEVEEAEVK